jgi:hypothetical protein
VSCSPSMTVGRAAFGPAGRKESNGEVAYAGSLGGEHDDRSDVEVFLEQGEGTDQERGLVLSPALRRALRGIRR